MADNELNSIEQAIKSGNFEGKDISGLLAELDQIIKIAKGSPKRHKGRDLTNWNRAVALKSELMGMSDGEAFEDTNSEITIALDERKREMMRLMSRMFMTVYMSGSTTEQILSVVSKLSAADRDKILKYAPPLKVLVQEVLNENC